MTQSAKHRNASAISPLVSRTEEMLHSPGKLSGLGYTSVFDIIKLSREQFIKKHRDTLGGQSGQMHDLAVGYARQVLHHFRHSRLSQSVKKPLTNPFTAAGPDYLAQFGDTDNWTTMVAPDAPEANDGPAGYLTALYEMALEKTGNATYPLNVRRPDIGTLLIDNDAINKVVPQIEIVNNILTAAIVEHNEDTHQLSDVNRLISTLRYPNTLPYHYAHKQIQFSQDELDITLQAITLPQTLSYPLKFLALNDPPDETSAAALNRLQVMASGLAPEEQRIVTEPDADLAEDLPGFYQKNFGDNTLTADSFIPMSTFTARTNLDVPAVEQLLGEDAGGSKVITSPNVTAGDIPSRYISAGIPATSGRFAQSTTTGAYALLTADWRDAQWNPDSGDLSFILRLSFIMVESDVEYNSFSEFQVPLPEGLTPDGPPELASGNWPEGALPNEQYTGAINNTTGNPTNLSGDAGDGIYFVTGTLYYIDIPVKGEGVSSLRQLAGLPLNFMLHRFYGAEVTLRGTWGLSMSVNKDPVTGELTLNSPTDTQMMHINRIIRLRRWLDLSFEDTDLLISATCAATDNAALMALDQNTLRMLGIFRHYQRRYGTTAKQFAAWLDRITPLAYTPDTPFFDQIFNSSRAFDTPLQADLKTFSYLATTGDDARRCKQIMAALELSHNQFIRLATRIADARDQTDNTLVCDLGTLTAFYRMTTLARTFELSVEAFCTLLDILDEGENTVLSQLAGRPVITPPSPERALSADVLSLLQALSWLCSWLQATRLPLFVPVTTAPAGSGTTAQLNTIKQVSQHLKTTLVQADMLNRSGAPVRTDAEASPVPIDWMSLLQTGNPDNALIDEEGLITDISIPDTLGSVVETLHLTDESKQQAITALTATLSGAKAAQDGIATSTLAQSLGCNASLVPLLLRWSDLTLYDWLSLTWRNRGLTTQADIPVDWLTPLSDLSQRSLLCQTLTLTPALLQFLLDNPAASGMTDEEFRLITMRTVYLLSRYDDLRKLAGTNSSTEDDILAWWSQALKSSDSDPLLAGLLGWDASEVALCSAQIYGIPAITTLPQLDTVMRLLDAAEKTGLSVIEQQQAFSLDSDKDYTDWQAVGQAMVSGVSHINAGQ